MKVLVTGGAGFIGSNIVDMLIAGGHAVCILDNLSSGKREHVNDSATFYEMDISDDVERSIKDEGIECIIHHAAQVQVRRSIEDPVLDARINILGSLNLLKSCPDVKKFIFASSGGAIYGEPEYNPADESHPTSPLSPYGVSKLAFEKYLYTYGESYGLDYISLRYGNVYGPRQDPYGEAGVVAIFANRMLKGEPPTINGDGNQTRDFVYVEDVARANLCALKKSPKERVINIGTGIEASVNEIFGSIQKSLETDITPINGPVIKGEVEKICLDVSRAKKELDWQSEFSIESGIGKYLEYLKSTF
ncbi:MAG: NAD-dependent epimerase/dehydratase family protein [Candidatus Hydrothermarchaeaceae archaeon]